MTEFYDRGFRPSVSRFTGRDHNKQLETWAMPSIAEPVPSQRQMRVAALWGQRLSRNGEFAVIALAIEPTKTLARAEDAEWYCGVGSQDEILRAENRLIAILDAASLPVASLHAAIVNLGLMLPYKEFHQAPQRMLPRREELIADLGEVL